MPVLAFGDYTLDLDQRLLCCGPEVRHLAPKAFDLLQILIAERPRVLSKQELMSLLWPDAFVTENNLATLITDLRAALGEAARQPVFIRTVHGVGYAFMGTVQEQAREGLRPLGVATWKLVWDRTELPLSEGENILGRPADGVIGLDEPTVSRRHARITIEGDQATVEDLGSKNGTWVGFQAVTSSSGLRDGDTLRLGSVVVTVRRIPGARSTQTFELDRS